MAAPWATTRELWARLAGRTASAPDGARLVLWLPSTSLGPRPSPRPVASWDEGSDDKDAPEAPVLAPWTVDGPRLGLAEEMLATDDRALVFTRYAALGGYLKAVLQLRPGVPCCCQGEDTPRR